LAAGDSLVSMRSVTIFVDLGFMLFDKELLVVLVFVIDMMCD